MTESFTLRSTDGLSLEATLDAPERVAATLVICHPHPRAGGTMNAPLLLAIRDRMNDAGWAVLRFNFRGIGNSEGSSGTGLEEVADARGALEVARERFVAPVAVLGWSFGGAVAIRTASLEPELAGCVAVAPAVRAKPGFTAGLPSPTDVEVSRPTLVVCGANDDQVSPADCKAWAEVAGVEYREIKGANHFFWAKYESLSETVLAFLAPLV